MMDIVVFLIFLVVPVALIVLYVLWARDHARVKKLIPVVNASHKRIMAADLMYMSGSKMEPEEVEDFIVDAVPDIG